MRHKRSLYISNFVVTLQWNLLIRCPSVAETERRQKFRDEIVDQLPFDLIGMDDMLLSVEIYVSGAEDSTNSHL